MRTLVALAAIVILVSACWDSSDVSVTAVGSSDVSVTAVGSSDVSVTEVEWSILFDAEGFGPGVHSIVTIAKVSPSDVIVAPRDLHGRLEWGGRAVVDLCHVEVRSTESEDLHIGDGYQTTEGCGSDKRAMQHAFNNFGPPDAACVGVRIDGADYEYCAPLNEIQR